MIQKSWFHSLVKAFWLLGLLAMTGCTTTHLEFDRMTGTAYPQPQTISGTPTDSITVLAAAAASSGPRFAPFGSQPLSRRQIACAPNSTHFLAHAPGSPSTSAKGSRTDSGQSSGSTSQTSIAIAGVWGMLPSK